MEFRTYLKDKGIRHELTVAHSPEQNGVAERMNRTLVESARAMIAHAELPDGYWEKAVSTAAYVRNRTPIKDDQTPYEQWYGRKPNVTHLRVFGCVAYSHVPNVECLKLDKKGEKMWFLGYSKESKGYRLLDERTRKIVTRRDVIFNEADFGVRAETETVKHKETVEVDPTSTEEGRQEVDEPRCSNRQK